MAKLTLKEYKGIEITLEKIELSEEAVSSYVLEKLSELAQESTQFVMVDRKATVGDLVNLEYKGLIDGIQFDGGTAENCDLILGSGRFIPGFEDQLIGCVAGEEIDVKIQFPDPYFYEEYSGKEAVFTCKIHAVYEPNTPEIDDEYAKKNGYEDLKALSMKYADETRQMHEKQVDENLEFELTEALIGLVEGDLSEEEVDHQLDQMVADFAGSLASAGMDFSTYLEETAITEEELRNSYRANAEKAVKLDTALMLVREAEKVAVTAEEVEAEYKRLMEAYSLTRENLQEYLPVEVLTDNLTRAKCMELVKKNARITWK